MPSNAAIERVRGVGAERSTGANRNAEREEQHRLQQAHDGSATRLVTGPTSATRPNAHATSGAVTTVATTLTIAPAASVRRSPRHDRGTTRRASDAAGDERRRAGDAELPAEVEHGARHRRAAPRRRARGWPSGASGAGAAGSRAARRASRRRARRAAARRSPRRRRRAAAATPRASARAGAAARAPSSSSASAMIADVQPRHAEHVHQPRVGVAIALLRVDRAHVGDDERADDAARPRRRCGRCARPSARGAAASERVGAAASDARRRCTTIARSPTTRWPRRAHRARRAAARLRRARWRDGVQPTAAIAAARDVAVGDGLLDDELPLRRAASASPQRARARASASATSTPPAAMAVAPPMQQRCRAAARRRAAPASSAASRRAHRARASAKPATSPAAYASAHQRDERHRADIARARRRRHPSCANGRRETPPAVRLSGHRQRLALAHDRAGERRAGRAGQLHGQVRAEHRLRRPARAPS